MNPDESQSDNKNLKHTIPPSLAESGTPGAEHPEATNATDSHIQSQEVTTHELTAVFRTLSLLQRQQHDQLRLLRQLLAEVEALKNQQTQQGVTVDKLDRRIRRARLWRVVGLLLRWSVVLFIIGAIVYLVGPTQIRTLWERLAWLLT